MKQGKLNKWNELDFYKEGQTIYGRDEEIYSISKGIASNVQTIIYGQSGVGKSSLLFAGVFPLLRKKMFFPIFIRLGMFQSGEYIDKIKESIINEALAENVKLGKPALTVNPKSLLNKDDLWSFFYSTEFYDQQGNIYIPVLVFDQFEEILNDKRTYEDARRLLLELYTLLDDNRIITEGLVQYTNYRIVLSLREDYLYCLEELIDQFNLSELRYNRFRVRWLNERNAKHVIISTFGQSLDKDDACNICDTIISNSKNESGDISTICLSLICSILEMKCGDRLIRSTDLDSIDDYLYKYYNLKLEDISYKAKKYLEYNLITPDGRRNSIDYSEAKRSGQITEEELNTLISNRLLRLVSLTGNSRIEFIHDIVPKLVVRKKKSYWFYVKKSLKEMNNIAGTATKQEMIVSNLFSLVIYILALSGGSLLFLYEQIGIMILYFGILIYFFLKFTMSLSIRRAHDVGISGWRCFSTKLNEESSVFPYSPKTSYYYCQTHSAKDTILGRLTKQSQALKVAINKYEFQAQLVKTMRDIYLTLLFTIGIGMSIKHQSISLTIYYFGAQLCVVDICILYYTFLKRINYMNINPYYGMIPFYNLYLFIKSFKKDITDNSNKSVYTEKKRHIFIPFIIWCVILVSIINIFYFITIRLN